MDRCPKIRKLGQPAAAFNAKWDIAAKAQLEFTGDEARAVHLRESGDECCFRWQMYIVQNYP